mmetsp:Transcript_11191/g.17123  ORF Transcript_11191/g.17123 Transcript_11191/m.17123 type:complete len:209 (+) Transcript_11191:3-629(+)
MSQFPNVLVLSAGGYGHVPIPLLKQPEKLQTNLDQNREYLMSFVGSLKNAPGRMRRKLNEELAKHLGDKYKYYHGDDWRDVMKMSRVSLAPRGYGRSSFHLMEILQSGLIPIHIYLDEPWVPYRVVFEKLGYHTKAQDLGKLVLALQSMKPEEFSAQEKLIASYRESHFTAEGVLNHIEQFLVGMKTDLECVKLPEDKYFVSDGITEM